LLLFSGVYFVGFFRHISDISDIFLIFPVL